MRMHMHTHARARTHAHAHVANARCACTMHMHDAHALQVQMSVLESSRRAPGVYERKVVMHARGEEIMQVCGGCRGGSRGRQLLQSLAATVASCYSRRLWPCLAGRPSTRTHLPPSAHPPSRREAWCTSLTRRGSMLQSASR